MSLSPVHSLVGAVATLIVMSGDAWSAEPGRYASSDSDSGYVHWIDLYDTSNRKITASSTRPYSPQNTCGRCHDDQSIAHGWHFNAFSIGSEQGRPSEPWIWSDPRIGTQLPLSYRQQPPTQTSTFDPRTVGLSPWQVTKKFGARFPGGGFGNPSQNFVQTTGANPTAGETETNPSAESADSLSPRWDLAGPLEIDCMVCHATSGQYDFETRRHHIEDENFAWAPTAAMHLAKVDGRVSRIKDDADPNDEKTQAALPKVSYDAGRFSQDDQVFFDIVRKPDNNACYQCHSTLQVNDDGIEPRWIHDDDVHLRAGMQCVDCHRNGIDHHIVRGYAGETRSEGPPVGTLTCQGCHLGSDSALPHSLADEIASRAGRLGAPKPLHAGLPPIHFEKLSCTACHAGPAPREEAIRIMTSLAHSLGEKVRRAGDESPQIQGPIYSKLADGKVYPQRVMWPAFWGTREGDSITPLDPDKVYQWIRRPLRVRKSFIEELASDPEQFNEKVSEALAVIEKETGAEQAVFVSTGKVYRRVADDAGESSLEVLPGEFDEAKMVTWPIAHNVRPAGWSLGATGCTECHSDTGKIFASTVTPLGPAPQTAEPMTMANLQGIDAAQWDRWNQLFEGRANFKVLVAFSLAIVFIILLIGLGAVGARFTRQRPNSGAPQS